MPPCGNVSVGVALQSGPLACRGWEIREVLVEGDGMTFNNNIRSLAYRARAYWSRRASPPARSSQDKLGGKHRADSGGRPVFPVGRAGARIYHPPSHRAH